MPSYQVLQKGFMFGRIYDPHGKRPILHSDEPVDPIPAWLKPIKEESATQKKKRAKKEKNAFDAAKEKSEQDKVDISNVTFTDAVGGTAGNLGIETL